MRKSTQAAGSVIPGRVQRRFLSRPAVGNTRSDSGTATSCRTFHTPTIKIPERIRPPPPHPAAHTLLPVPSLPSTAMSHGSNHSQGSSANTQHEATTTTASSAILAEGSTISPVRAATPGYRFAVSCSRGTPEELQMQTRGTKSCSDKFNYKTFIQ